MLSAGATESDPDVMVLQKRKTRQEKEVAKFKAKAPSAKLRKLALVEAQDAFLKTTQTQKEFAEKGRAKAQAGPKKERNNSKN